MDGDTGWLAVDRSAAWLVALSMGCSLENMVSTGISVS